LCENAGILCTDVWKKYIVDKYGGRPQITCYDSPVIVDNLAGEIITGARIEHRRKRKYMICGFKFNWPI